MCTLMAFLLREREKEGWERKRETDGQETENRERGSEDREREKGREEGGKWGRGVNTVLVHEKDELETSLPMRGAGTGLETLEVILGPSHPPIPPLLFTHLEIQGRGRGEGRYQHQRQK